MSEDVSDEVVNPPEAYYAEFKGWCEQIPSRDHAPIEAQEYLVENFRMFYIHGRASVERHGSFEENLFKIALNNSKNPLGIFSVDGAKDIDYELYQEAEYQLVGEEDISKFEYQESRDDVTRKKDRLITWRQEHT